MRCPKCDAANSDEAEFCTLCFESFRAKPASASAPPGPSVPERWVFRDACAESDGWVARGPLLALPEGLYFFVGTDAFEGSAVRWLATMLLGDLGGVLGGRIVDAAVENHSSNQRRPSWLGFRHRQEIADTYHPALAEAPEIVPCAEYFHLARGSIAAVWAHQDGAIVELAGGQKLELHGTGDWAGFARAAAAWRYPAISKTDRPRRRWGWALAAFLAVVGAAAGVKELYELGQANAQLARHDGVSGVLFSPEGTRYIMPNGSDVAAEDLSWSERLPLYRFGLIFGFLVLMAWMWGKARSL